MHKLVIEIPDYLHKALKNRVFSEENTIKNFVTELLMNELKVKERTNANEQN